MLTRYFEGEETGEPTADAWPTYKPIIIQVGSTAIICTVGGEGREGGRGGVTPPHTSANDGRETRNVFIRRSPNGERRGGSA